MWTLSTKEHIICAFTRKRTDIGPRITRLHAQVLMPLCLNYNFYKNSYNKIELESKEKARLTLSYCKMINIFLHFRTDSQSWY